MDEPRPVPMIETVVQTWWYCLECGNSNQSRQGAEYHWKSNHAEAPTENATNGIDVASGAQLLLMQFRRREWIEQQARHFLEEMHPDFGADDFVAEAEIRDA